MNPDFFRIFAQLGYLLKDDLKAMDLYMEFYSKIYDFLVGATIILLPSRLEM